MAKISLSPLVVDIRNKIGDTVFSKWKGINYVRSRVDPSNPNTENQQEVRNALKVLVLMWQALGGVHKICWDAWTSGRNLSGFNGYIGVNEELQREADLLTLCKGNGDTALTALSGAAGSLTKEIDITFAASPVPTGKKLIVVARKVTAGLGEGALEKFEIAAAQTSPQTLTMAAAATDYEVYAFIASGTLAAALVCSDALGCLATSKA